LNQNELLLLRIEPIAVVLMDLLKKENLLDSQKYLRQRKN
jgi:hypothetical protein